MITKSSIAGSWLCAAIACVGCAAMVLLAPFSQHPSAVVMLDIFAALTALNYELGGRDVLYPAFIFSGSWAAATIVYLLCPVQIDGIAWRTVLIFAGGAICFTVGCAIGNRQLAAGAISCSKPESSNVGVRLLLLCCLLILPFLVMDSVRFVGQSILSPEFLMASKEAIRGADAPSFSSRFLSLAQMISIPTLWLLLLENERKLLILIGACVAVFMSLLGGTRGPLLQMICGCLVVVLIRKSERTLKSLGRTIVISALALVSLMTLLSLVLKKETQGSDGLQVAVNMAAVYIAGGLPAFNYQVLHPRLFGDQPWNTVTPIMAPLVKEGLIHIELPPVNEEFINIPFPFNVFTIYKPYYHDGGIVGCMLALGCAGLLYGYIFWAAVRGNRVAVFFLATLMESLVMSIFHDPFNYRLTFFVFMVVFAAAYFLILRKLPRITFGRLRKA